MISKSEPTVIRKGENTIGRELMIYGDRIRVKVAGTDTDNRYAMFEGEVGPKDGPPLHMHTREDEVFHVMEGTFLFEANGEQHVLTAGDALFAPRGIPHTFQNIGETKGRLLTLVEPAGLERFFADVADATAGTTAPDMGAMQAIFDKYGLELLGPPMKVRTQAASA